MEEQIASAGSAARLCIAFAGDRRLATGTAGLVAAAAKRALEAGETAPILVFDEAASELVELDLRGSEADVEARYAVPVPVMATVRQGPGRPKLGVVAKDVTLLPRHWEWLARQPGGASATLRKLVEQARRANSAADAKRQARDATYRFCMAMAGDAPGYEEAMRALFAGDANGFEVHTRIWPPDVQAHARKLGAAALGG